MRCAIFATILLATVEAKFLWMLVQKFTFTHVADFISHQNLTVWSLYVYTLIWGFCMYCMY